MTQESPTPLQRAEAIAARWNATGSALTAHIAAAVREAVLEERERCALAALEQYPGAYREMTRSDPVGEWVGQAQIRAGRDIAAALRARPAP